MSNRKNRRAANSSSHTKQMVEPNQDEIGFLITLFNQGRFEEAEAFAKKVTQFYPKFGFGWKVLGAILKSTGRIEESLLPMQKAIDLLPSDAQALTNLGITLKELRRLEDAKTCYLRAIKLKPDYAEAYNTLGNILKDLGELEASEKSYKSALTIAPNYSDAHCNIGVTLTELGRFDEAEISLHNALSINPNDSNAYYHLGNLLKKTGHFKDAEKYFRQALNIDPKIALAHFNLAVTLTDLQLMDEAEASCRNALKIKPDFIIAQSALLFLLNYRGDQNLELSLEEAHKFGQIVTNKVKSRFTAWNCPDNPARLRVGFVSGDLRDHPVGYFMESILKQIDLSRFEFIVYATNKMETDLTFRIKPFISTWRTIVDIEDEAAALLIHSDAPHILFDLSGHSEFNRLSLFAWKPAPVQVSWLGYFATTGVKEIDYLLCDKTGVPDESKKYFTETLWYLPDTRLCFSTPEYEITVSELPSLQSGIITFGCFQNIAKIEPAVLDIWSKILDAIPNSQLRFQHEKLDNQSFIAIFKNLLTEHKIDTDRVTIVGYMPRFEYLKAYSNVDLILDTFPYPGGTTTCEALWMGVPTITLAGRTLLERQGASILNAAGVPEFITRTKEEYQAKAIELTSNLEHLSKIRSGLRLKIVNSPLFDAERFAKNFEDALWGMWKVKENLTP